MIPEPIYVTYTPPRIHVRRSRHHPHGLSRTYYWRVITEIYDLTYDSWGWAVAAADRISRQKTAVIPASGLVSATRRPYALPF